MANKTNDKQGWCKLKIPERKASFEAIESDELTKAYARMNNMPHFVAIRQLFVGELKKMGPFGTLVDVGCGPGSLLKFIAKRFPSLKLAGCDLSQDMLDRARENLANYDIKFVLGSSDKMPFEDCSVNFIVSTMSLHHWNDPIGGFNELNRVLSNGGKFLLMDVRRDAPAFMYWLIRNVAKLFIPYAIKNINEPLGSFLASYTIDELRQMMKKTPFTGFKVEKGFGWSYVSATKKA